MKLIAGPCAVEDKETCRIIAEKLCELKEKYDLNLIFKGSYKKANRTKLDSFTTIGSYKALEILSEIKDEFGLDLITDIHESKDAKLASDYVDYLQIPAFLCRQTDLLLAAGRYAKKGVNIKKGQFLGPEMMEFQAKKVLSENPLTEIYLTERGTTFGYNYLVTDMTSFPKMNPFGISIMDCTHSVQVPNQSSGITGGDSKMIGTIARAAIAAGADGLFIEVHPEPKRASSDAASILRLTELESIIKDCVNIRKALS